jgi:dihydrofolate reductase
MNINIIVAYCNNNGIGFENQMPWHIKSDLKKFQKLTTGKGNNAIIMGRNTFESIKCKPLSNRDNLILSSTLNINEKINNKYNPNNNNIIKSFLNITLLEDFLKTKNYDEIWVIGGTKIYELFLNQDISPNLQVQNIYETYIDKEFKCDTFFPKINTELFRFISQEIHIKDYNLKNTDLDNDFNIFDRVYKRSGVLS